MDRVFSPWTAGSPLPVRTSLLLAAQAQGHSLNTRQHDTSKPAPECKTCTSSAPLATTPAESLGAYIVLLPQRRGLPRITGGAASALPFSRPAQRSLLVTACALAESLADPFTSEASTASLPPQPFRLLPAGTTLAGWGSHPLRLCTFARRTEIFGLIVRRIKLSQFSVKIS